MINYLRGHWISDMLRDSMIINLHVIFVCFLVFFLILVHWMKIELIAYIVWFIRYLKYMYDKGLYR